MGGLLVSVLPLLLIKLYLALQEYFEADPISEDKNWQFLVQIVSYDAKDLSRELKEVRLGYSSFVQNDLLLILNRQRVDIRISSSTREAVILLLGPINSDHICLNLLGHRLIIGGDVVPCGEAWRVVLSQVNFRVLGGMREHVICLQDLYVA